MGTLRLTAADGRGDLAFDAHYALPDELERQGAMLASLSHIVPHEQHLEVGSGLGLGLGLGLGFG